MFNKARIVFKLFKNSFFFTGTLFFVALVTVLTIISLKDAYQLNLNKEFTSKQPHIKISFVNDKTIKNQKQIQQEIKYIYKQSNLISAITPFSSGNKFFMVFGMKLGGNAFYNGNIEIIGLGKEDMVYDFFSSKFVNRGEFQLPYTPLEFLYNFQTKDNIMIFNKSLFSSFFPVLESVEKVSFENKNKKYSAKLAGIFNDYDTQPKIYTSIQFANKLLNKNPNEINGYYLNAKSLEDIDKLTKILKSKLDKTKYNVSSWLEERAKQKMMFYIFNSLSSLIVFIILVLCILFILLLLYNAIVKKSYQLSVLYTIGYYLKKEIFISIFSMMTLFSALALFTISKVAYKLANMLHLKLSNSFLYDSLSYTLFIDFIFIVLIYILIDNAYKLKAKSVF